MAFHVFLLWWSSGSLPNLTKKIMLTQPPVRHVVTVGPVDPGSSWDPWELKLKTFEYEVNESMSQWSQDSNPAIQLWDFESESSRNFRGRSPGSMAPLLLRVGSQVGYEKMQSQMAYVSKCFGLSQARWWSGEAMVEALVFSRCE